MTSDLGYRSKADLVTDHLRAELQAGRPGPGQRLVVSQVAERLGVSKVPVREAVTRLVGEGLLLHSPNVGPLVPAFTAEEVHETALMRVAIESIAIESALPRHNEASVNRLDELLVEMQRTGVDFPALNVRFHTAVVEPTHYREMHRLVCSLLARAQRYAIVHSVPGYLPEAHQEHLQLADAVRDGDLQLLLELNANHVLHAAEKLIARM